MSQSTNINCKRIMQTLQQQRQRLRSFGVSRLRLFGSSARGEASAVSDLDFLVEFEKKSFDAYMDLKEFLEKLFDRPVDLVLADALKPRLRSAILKDAVDVEGLESLSGGHSDGDREDPSVYAGDVSGSAGPG